MENISVLSNKEQGRQLNLPPGFRFHPTDEELLTYYLYKKVTQPNFSAIAIGEVDIYKSEPWDLPWKAKMGEDEWYFFCMRDRKYQASLRSNRATRAGFWKSTGRDGEIYRGRSLIGMKKTLVFYKGRAPKGEKTNWIMHEYRLDGRFSVPSSSRTNKWIICRVFRKTFEGKKTHFSGIMRWESIGNRQGSSGSVSLSPPAINTDLVHVSCFSSPCYDENEQAGNLHSAGNSLSGIFSNPQESVPRIPLQAPMNLPLSDSAFTVQEQNFLDSVIENRGSSLRNGFMSAMTEQMDGVSPETGHTATYMDPEISSLISSFGNQQNPSASYAAPAPVDLDNLNNFCSYYCY